MDPLACFAPALESQSSTVRNSRSEKWHRDVPAFGAIRRGEFVRVLRSAGFDGPYSGGKHQFMIRDGRTLRIPNPHESDISKDLLSRLLRQAGIDSEEWERL